MNQNHRAIMDAILNADLATLEEIATHESGFPEGGDDSGRYWITHAVDCGSCEIVEWMLARGASPLIPAEDGYTVLHSAIERDMEDKYPVMRALIAAGVNVDEIGIHGYTPAHLAAVRNDVEALKVLHENGADFSIRTTVDNYYTPLEEARSLNEQRAGDAIRYLETLG